MSKNYFLKTYWGVFLFAYFVLNTTQAQQNPRRINVDWLTDKSKTSIPLNELKIVVPRDAIPPIHNPYFWDLNQASQIYFNHEPVISVEINNESKAYPLSILIQHEMVNDVLGGIPILVTYCPLCNAAIVFDRRLTFNNKQQTLTFGVSGMLRNSDMIMWDNQSQSWWQQFSGESLVGKYSGAQLLPLPSMLISFKNYVDDFPNGKVLSTRTGHTRDYGTTPYVGYDSGSNNHPMLFDGEIDKRLRPTERVISVYGENTPKIYPLSVVQKMGVINDYHENLDLVIFHLAGTTSAMDKKQIKNSKEIGATTVFNAKLNGKILIFTKKENHFIDEQTLSTWTITGQCIEGELQGSKLTLLLSGNHFAFAWFAFHPKSAIFNSNN